QTVVIARIFVLRQSRSSLIKRKLIATDIVGNRVETGIGFIQLLIRHFGLQQDMTGVDTVATFFDQLDDMETILRLYDFRDLLGILQVESDIGVFGNHLPVTHKTGFTTFDSRAAIFGIQQGKGREITFTLIDTVGVFTQASFYIFNFGNRYFRLLRNNLYFYLGGDVRNTVLGKLLKVTAYFRRSHFDLTYQF